MAAACPKCNIEMPVQARFCMQCGSDVGGAPVSTVVHPTSWLPRGTRLGPYEIEQLIGEGGAGTVHRARDRVRDRIVAIKVLHPSLTGDSEVRRRFVREARLMRTLSHPNIASVFDLIEEQRLLGIVMEYVEGPTLSTELARWGGRMPYAVIRAIMTAVLNAMDAAHRHGVIHRDLKPDNIFLVESPEGDQIRILDFGSVKLQMETGPKLTAFGTTLGSPYYMSPEQAMGKADVDNRTDGFALAAIFYEMLSGKIAFDGKQVAEILMKIVNSMPEPLSRVAPGMPPGLDDLIEKGVAKDKKKRFGSTTELAAAAFQAFGLQATADRASIEAWGKKPVAEIEAALATATPPAPAAYGAPMPMGVTPLPNQAPVAAAPMSVAPPAGGRSMMPIVIGGLVLLIVISLCGTGLLFFFNR